MSTLKLGDGRSEMTHSQTEQYMLLLDMKTSCIHSNCPKVTKIDTAASTPGTNNNVSTKETFQVSVYGVVLLIVVLLPLLQHLKCSSLNCFSQLLQSERETHVSFGT